ncbi:iron-sulfur cluster repair di-iron protein [Bacillus sp. FJAT-45350]|uniref:iron-sulfur cluster repair di-iron protein n=1 Tax=Bacillus sp. FJAT-45350 TaxID=2011014 RepID=UPI000BB7F09A|nr:iron-sulfur cluster repair di-iron protein [Bacillus sp. FJAT-45350]
MEVTFDFSTRTGEIVTRLPEASTILKQYKIDFCCGGNRPIGEVITEKKLDGDEILAKINEAYLQSLEKPSVNRANLTSSQLIKHIISTHHAYLSTLLPELSQFTTKVLRVHGRDCPELAEVHKLFHLLKIELEQHTIDEEQNVFPLIEAFENEPTTEIIKDISVKIEELVDEHEGAGGVLAELRKVTNDFTAPQWACMTFQLTYQKLENLEADLFEHIHLENNILFPRVIKKLKELN